MTRHPLAGGLYRTASRLRVLAFLPAAMGLALTTLGSGPGALSAQTVNTATVTLTPAGATVAGGGTVAYYAAVSGSASQTITWFVDGVSMGNGTTGVLSANGNGAHMLYTAPAAGGAHTILAVATNAAGAGVSGSTQVTVQGASSPVSSNPATVTLSPAGATVAPGSATALYAAVSGSASQTLAWFVDGIAMGSGTTGLLTSNGNGAHMLYTAPGAGGAHTVTVVATNAANASVSGSTTLTVQGGSAVGVTLNPSGSSTVSPSGTRAFSATVTGTSNTAVLWTVDDVASGSASTGTLTGSGASVTYTAPASTGTHTVTAASAANTSVSASTVVLVQPASAVSVALAHIGPDFLARSGSTLFTATVTGTSNTAVTWAVDGIANGNASTGTIYAPIAGNTVVYSAPAESGSHTVTATSAADASKGASTTLTVAPSIIQTASIPVAANVRNAPYNATGNGVNDDTAAIQAAVNAVAGTGRAVVVPPGTYLINPRFSGVAGIRLGSNMTFILQSGAVLKAISTSSQNYTVVICSGVHDVNITGGGMVLGNNLDNTIPTPTSVEGGDCISIANSQNIVVEGVSTQSAWNDGIYIGYKSTNVVINNVDCSLNRRNGMSVTDGQNIVVSSSNFHNNLGSVETAGASPVNGNGVDIEANAGQSISTMLFSANRFLDNRFIGLAWGVGYSTALGSTTGDVFVIGNTASGNRRGLDGENCPHSVVANNTCDRNSGFGIFIHDGATNSLIRGNTVTNTGSAGDGAGIELYNESGTTVDRNSSSGSSRFGILSYQSTNPTITNNTLSGNGQAGLSISNSTGITQSGNTP